MRSSSCSQDDRIPLAKTALFISLLLIIVSGFFVYSNTLDGKFIWDDYGLVEDNLYIRSPKYIPDIFAENIGSGAQNVYGFYQPFQILTYILDYYFWKLNPFSYHLTNILFHILVTLSLYWFVFLISKDWFTSLISAIFFIIHPIHTEAVSYISGRAEILSCLFILSSCIFYIRFTQKKNILYGILVLFSFIVSLLSKENALVLPLLIGVYCYTFRKKVHKEILMPAVGIILVYIVIRSVFLDIHLPHRTIDTTSVERIPRFFSAIASYIGLLFLPFDLHMDYGSTIYSISEPSVVLGLMTTLILLFSAFKIKERNRIVSFSIFFFFVGLLPVSNIYPINAYMAEHWLYLPSVGFFL